MSIDKMKDMIRMIESEDYSINELVTSLNQNDVEALKKASDPSGLLQKMGFKQTDAQRILQKLGAADANIDKGRAIANKALGGASAVAIGDYFEDDPSGVRDKVHAIFTVLSDFGCLTNEIDSTDFSAAGGYKKFDNQLRSQRKAMVTLVYDNEQLDTLMNIRFKVTDFDAVDVDECVDELNRNRSVLGIRRASVINSFEKLIKVTIK